MGWVTRAVGGEGRGRRDYVMVGGGRNASYVAARLPMFREGVCAAGRGVC